MTNRQEQSAIVFGGSGGLGAGCVRALARDWPAVAIAYRNGKERAEAVASSLSERCHAYPVQCDVSDPESVRRTVAEVNETCGPIGCAVFSAGCAIDQPYINDIAESQWRDVLETETIGFIRIMAALIPQFRDQGGGNIIAVTSMANSRVIVGDTISAAPKAAIEALCKGIAKEEGKYGIRANTVAPGAMNAGLGEQYIAERMSPQFWDNFRKSIPLRRFGLAEDIGEAVAFFASSRASYLTGQSLVVDGGYTL